MFANSVQLPLLRQTARERLYRCYVAQKRPRTRETLAANLRMLMDLKDWTQVQLAQKEALTGNLLHSSS
jgi:hypothetical protein